MVYPSNGTWLSTAEFSLCLAFLILCPTFVALRLWARSLTAKSRQHLFTVSDLLVVLGCLATVGNTVCFVIEIVTGVSGRHTDDVADKSVVAVKASYAAGFLWVMASCALKSSILCLYTELFPPRGLRMSAYTLNGLITAFFIAFIIVNFCECSPFSRNWEKNEPGKCINETASSQAAAIISPIIDLMITVIPVPVIWRLHMPVRKRLSIVLIFGLGFCVDGAAIARAITFQPLQSTDYHYNGAKSNILAGVELWLGTIVACIPCLRPVFSKANQV